LELGRDAKLAADHPWSVALAEALRSETDRHTFDESSESAIRSPSRSPQSDLFASVAPRQAFAATLVRGPSERIFRHERQAACGSRHPRGRSVNRKKSRHTLVEPPRFGILAHPAC
jgi:hypothetical protein